MKLFVIGATGRTGREIVEQALARGHDVTAFVRSPGTITLRNERLTVLKGTQRTKTSFLRQCKITTRSSRHSGRGTDGVDWTIVRPPRLTQEDYSTYRSREGSAPKMGFTVSRKAVAAFMLDAIEQNKHLRKIVGIAK